MSKVKLQCPGCKTAYAVDDRLAGKTVKCARCHKVFLARPFSGASAPGFRAEGSASGSAHRPAATQASARDGEVPLTGVSGSWLGAIWEDRPIDVPRRLDIPQFFGQLPMPMLFPNDEGYVRRVRRNAEDTARRPGELGYAGCAEGNPERALQMDLALQWIVVLLHHPSEVVILDVLRYWEEKWGHYVASETAMPYQSLFYDSIADHLLSKNRSVVDAAVRFVWRTYSPDNFEKLFSILLDPEFPDCQAALRRVGEACPPENRTQFKAVCNRFRLPCYLRVCGN